MQPSNIPVPWNTRYKIARIILGTVFVIAGIYFSYLILFPSQSFVFDFKNPQASKNTLLDPHAPDGTSLGKGNISANTPLVIDAALAQGDYSVLAATLTPEKKSTQILKQIQDDTQIPQGSITVRKSYRAFFLPTGAPITQEAHYDNRLHSNALLSFADGVFLIDGNFVRPIGDAVIFANLGYDWNDVSPASEEDMGAYEKGKIVLMGNMHPDGTVFYATDTHTYYLIQNKEKHPIASEELAQSYLQGTHPILVSEKALAVSQSCDFTLSGIFQKSYTCSAPIDTLKELPGDSYRLTIVFDDSVEMRNAETILSSHLSIANLRQSLSQIKQRILSHYGYGQ